jgi:hypothetical protein
MALEVYLQEDIAHGIVAVAVGMLSASAAQGMTNVEYCRGVVDTVRAQALNYRIPWPRLQRDLISNLSRHGYDHILDALAAGDVVQVAQRS